jgi:hypothetical protein
VCAYIILTNASVGSVFEVLVRRSITGLSKEVLIHPSQHSDSVDVCKHTPRVEEIKFIFIFGRFKISTGLNVVLYYSIA